MIKKIITSFSILAFIFHLPAQGTSHQNFKEYIYSLPFEDAVKEFDQRLIMLAENNSEEAIFHTLQLKIEFADSNHNKQLKSYAVSDIINYPQFMDNEEYYDYLYEAGVFQNKIGNQDKGIELFLKAADVAEMIGNDTLLTSIHKRIGIVFSSLNNPELAKKYLFKSLDIAEKMTYDKGISSVCMTIGNVYKNNDSYDSAMVYYTKSIDFAKKAGYERGIAGNYNNIGNLYIKKNQYDIAIDYFLNAIPLNDAMGNLSWLGINYSNLGGLYADLGKNEEALFYLKKSLKIKRELEDSAGMGSDFRKRSDIYASINNYRQAFIDLKTSKEIEKRFQNSEKKALASFIEGNFQNEKKESIIKKLKAEKEVQETLIKSQNEQLQLEARLQKENDRILWGAGIVLMGLVFVIFAFWRNNQQRRKYTKELSLKNNEIESVNNSLDKAKHVLTAKNEEILDSITYAKRIQAAILPSEKYLHQSLKEAFVLYLPKDIVAGDFYWTEVIDDTVLFAVADCTGHGVPGAMVSVICNNALNDTIKLKAITDPGEILDYTTDLVLNQFAKSEEEVKDGMDIGLCAFDRKSRTLKFAGANIPLWLVRNNEVVEIKATRQPVGSFSKRKKFVTHNVPVQDGDMVYLSSDGFADQFGGEKNKKFMKKNFKNLLAEISEKPLDEQNNVILDTFAEWKAKNEQVDDICVMGVKFKAS